MHEQDVARFLEFIGEDPREQREESIRRLMNRSVKVCKRWGSDNHALACQTLMEEHLGAWRTSLTGGFLAEAHLCAAKLWAGAAIEEARLMESTHGGPWSRRSWMQSASCRATRIAAALSRALGVDKGQLKEAGA